MQRQIGSVRFKCVHPVVFKVIFFEGLSFSKILIWALSEKEGDDDRKKKKHLKSSLRSVLRRVHRVSCRHKVWESNRAFVSCVLIAREEVPLNITSTQCSQISDWIPSEQEKQSQQLGRQKKCDVHQCFPVKSTIETFLQEHSIDLRLHEILPSVKKEKNSHALCNLLQNKLLSV